MRTRTGLAALLFCLTLAAASGYAAEPRPMKVTLAPPSLVLNGASAGVVVEDAPGAAAPRFVTSLGAVDAAGRFAVAGRRAPAWAIVAAIAGEARAASIVTLVGAGALPTQTKPGARVTVEIAGRSFGPVTADARGNAAVPVEVPPEAHTARVHAVDQSGFETTREVTLPAADFPLAIVVAPAEVTADEDAVITVFAITRAGGWRPATGAPPALELPAALVAAGPARVPTPGRWDFPVRARLDAAEAAAAPIGARVDGVPALGASLAVHALPAAELKRRPPPPPPPDPTPAPRPELALRAGVARGGDALVSWTGAADAAWPLGANRWPALHLVASVGLANGQEDTRETRLSQLDLTLGLRLRVPLGVRAHIDAATGAGWAFADATVSSPGNGPSRRASDDAPLLYVGGAFGFRLGPGDAFVDLRWNDVRLAGDTGVRGVALGLAATVGFALRL